jgi:PAS domain-containing protein
MSSDIARPGSTNTSSLSDRRSDLGIFLRSRREALTPATVGLPSGRRRIVKGLRREEVAELADIGVVWYTFLEQGRPINISEDLLRRVAGALKLNGEETAYVLQLAGKFAGVQEPDDLAFGVTPDVQATLDAFAGPASVMNLRYDVIAWNAAAARVFGYRHDAGWRHNNRVWSKFFDPAARVRFRNWEHSAANLVAMLRSMSTAHVGDPRFDELFLELRESAEFNALWNGNRVGREPVSVVELCVEGHELDVFSIRATILAAPGSVFFFNPPADERSRAVLETLARD